MAEVLVTGHRCDQICVRRNRDFHERRCVTNTRSEKAHKKAQITSLPSPFFARPRPTLSRGDRKHQLSRVVISSSWASGRLVWGRSSPRHQRRELPPVRCLSVLGGSVASAEGQMGFHRVRPWSLGRSSDGPTQRWCASWRKKKCYFL